MVWDNIFCNLYYFTYVFNYVTYVLLKVNYAKYKETFNWAIIKYAIILHYSHSYIENLYRYGRNKIIIQIHHKASIQMVQLIAGHIGLGFMTSFLENYPENVQNFVCWHEVNVKYEVGLWLKVKCLTWRLLGIHKNLFKVCATIWPISLLTRAFYIKFP